MQNHYQEEFSTKLKIIQVKLWFGLARYHFDGKTPQEIEIFLHPEKYLKGCTNRPSLWRRYERGDCRPTQKTLSKIASYFPDSSTWLEHPIWSILGFHSVNFNDGNRIIWNLSPDIAKLFIHIGIQQHYHFLFRYPIDYYRLQTALTLSQNLLDSLLLLFVLLVSAIDAHDFRSVGMIRQHAIRTLTDARKKELFRLVDPYIFDFFRFFFESLHYKNEVDYCLPLDSAMYDKLNIIEMPTTIGYFYNIREGHRRHMFEHLTRSEGNHPTYETVRRYIFWFKY